MARQLKSVDQAELLRYIINGLVATTVHFGVLSLNIQAFEMRSAGLANLIAAIFGIATSFLGSRYFVFDKREDPILTQAMLFMVFYAFIACLHGLVLYLWTDVYGNDYRIGFIFATVFQVVLSYSGNRTLVFKA